VILMNNIVLAFAVGSNHALQRTAPCVTAPVSTAAFPPTMQVPRRTPRSLSLGSLCRFALLTKFWLLFEMKG
jgi:hypothetical protein